MKTRKFVNKYCFTFLTLGCILYIVYLNQYHHSEEMKAIKPLIQKLDSIVNHINFMDSSHFDWCGFEPNGKYTAYK